MLQWFLLQHFTSQYKQIYVGVKFPEIPSYKSVENVHILLTEVFIINYMLHEKY